ncbi:hypothetical protein IU449_27470 [Nocardia higoensis]|uniref:Uncharacterized protein n=1 Tax=Nocardia higoensis TaxID=228599 RepID=A0ABS0DIF9_9NOCA|nr:hypothetical protein [Nocardia higoensis]MBF6358241.1 hypothetical protein [Nocardia higoensis]
MDPLTDLIIGKMQEASVSAEALTRAIYGPGSPYKGRVTRRISNGVLNEDDIAFLHTSVELLQIRADELLRALLPGVPTAESLVIANKELRMKLNAIHEHLATDPGESGIGVVRDITASGRWACGILPYLSGPSDTLKVLTTTRVAVTLSRPELLEEGKTVRGMFMEDFGQILGDRAVFAGPAVRPLALPAVPTAPDQVVHLLIPAFSRDRSPSPMPLDLPKLGTSIVIVSTLQSAWCSNVAALVGRAIGWGVENASSVRRVAAPILDGDRDLFIARMNKLRNDGLRSKLLKPTECTVLHHTGHAVVDTNGELVEGHPVVDLLSADFDFDPPFLVVLRESDGMIANQDRVALRFKDASPRWPVDRWAAWRDELVDSVEPLVRQRRAMIVDLDYPWATPDSTSQAPEDAELSNQLLWQRTIKSAVKIVSRLLEWGGAGIKHPPTNLDPEAESLLKTEWRY